MVAQTRNFLLDGANLGHHIDECEFHGPLTFEFRPVTRLERGDFLRKLAKLTDAGRHAEAEVETDHFLRGRILSWDAVDASGGPLEVSPEAISRMEPLLFEKFLNAVLGLTPAVAKQLEDDAKN